MNVLRRVLKVVLKTILIILGGSILICLCIIPFDNKVREEIRQMTIENVDLDKIEDGKYVGDYKNQLRTYSVEVTIKNHKITNIKPMNNSISSSTSNKLFDKVMKEQKVNVDTISGATITSKTILKAIETALK